MIFSSTPETNDDPKPLYLVNIDMRIPGTEDDVIEHCERWLPRPEFDRAHKPNSILVGFREHDWYYVEMRDEAALWILGLVNYATHGTASPEQIDHANRVLTRLARLA